MSLEDRVRRALVYLLNTYGQTPVLDLYIVASASGEGEYLHGDSVRHVPEALECFEIPFRISKSKLDLDDEFKALIVKLSQELLKKGV